MREGNARRWAGVGAVAVAAGFAVLFLTRQDVPSREGTAQTASVGVHTSGQPVGGGPDLDLAGQWTITTARQRLLGVSLRRDGPRRWQLAGAQPTVFDGVYVSRGDTLVMVSSPGSYHSMAWVAGSGSGTDSVAFTLTTTAYASATLRRGTPAATSPVVLPLPHPRGRVPQPPAPPP